MKACCTNCGKEHDFISYNRINVSSAPELKAKVKDGSLFVWTCPDCGQLNLQPYRTLYHDPASKIMVWLFPENSVSEQDRSIIETKMQAISNQMQESGEMEGYLLRRVDDVGSLIEKVNIHDSGLDDTVVEMCKYVTKLEMTEKIADISKSEAIMNAPFKFFKLEGADNEIILSFPQEGLMKVINIGFNVYEDCRGILGRNPSIKPDTGFAKVDIDWLKKFFR